MDDLDRLFFELVEVLRRDRRRDLTGALKISELHGHLVPYRRVRDRVGFRSNGDYETALTRLLAGDRDYVRAEQPELQEELKAGLEKRVPEVQRYRDYPESRVWINDRKIPPPGDARYAPPEIRDRMARLGEERRAGPELDLYEEPGTSFEERQAEGDDAVRAEGGGSSEEPVPGSAPPLDSELGVSVECPACGSTLASHGEVAFSYCPYCGESLASDVCTVCGVKLKAEWSFCPGCGAHRSGPDDSS